MPQHASMPSKYPSREEERLAREAARRSRGVIVVVRRVTTLIIR